MGHAPDTGPDTGPGPSLGHDALIATHTPTRMHWLAT